MKVCNDCGLIIVTDESGIDEYCPKCGSENIIEEREEPEYNWAKEHGDYDHSREDEARERREREY